MMRFPIALLLTLPLLAAAPVEEARGRFGDFTYDASTYTVEGDGPFVVRRRRDRDDGPVLMASIEQGPAGACSMAKLDAQTKTERHDRDRKFQTISRDGFEIHMVSWYLGCRNARPPSVAACTAYRGRVYRFSMAVLGCGGGPGFSARPEGFLGSLAAAP